MADRQRRHDGAELVLFLPPHDAIRLPAQVTNEHGRCDVVPNNMVEGLIEPGHGLLVDYGALTRLERPLKLYSDRDDYYFDRSFLRRWY